MYKILLFVLIYTTFLFAYTKSDRIEKAYFKSGELRYKLPFKNEKKEGIAEIYYETGELKNLVHFKNNVKNGMFKTYYKNGKLESEIPYIDDKREGIGKKYYESGELLSETTLKDDKSEGIGKIYYKTGELRSETTFKDGKAEGIAKTYYKTGEIREEIFLINYKREGLCKEYYKNGNIKSKVYYRNGKKEKTINYSKNGKILQKTREVSINFDLGLGKYIYIKNYDDLIKTTKNLMKPIDQRWIFVDKNNDVVSEDDPNLLKYVRKFYYFMLEKKVEIQTKTLPSGSMKNTIYNNESIFVFKGLNTIFRGGIFAFYYPKDKKLIYAKRCVASGGDVIFLKDKSLYLHPIEGNKYVKQYYKNYKIKNIDNKLFIKDPYKKKHPGIHHDIDVIKKDIPQLFDISQITIPKNECFMMGDNRDHSHDSRFWGSVNQEFIIGVVVPIKLKARSNK